MIKAALIMALLVASSLSMCSAGAIFDAGSGNSEAKRQAEKFWASQVTKCGDSYYRKEVLPKKGDYVLLYEMKEPTVLAEPSKLSDADRLNGIEWDGRTIFSPKSSRVWGQDPGTWYEWKKGMGNVPELSYPMKKAGGQWSVDTKRHWTREETSKYVPVDCSQIPR